MRQPAEAEAERPPPRPRRGVAARATARRSAWRRRRCAAAAACPAVLAGGEVCLHPQGRLGGSSPSRYAVRSSLHGAAHARLLAGVSAPDCHPSTALATLRVARWMRLFTAPRSPRAPLGDVAVRHPLEAAEGEGGALPVAEPGHRRCHLGLQLPASAARSGEFDLVLASPAGGPPRPRAHVGHPVLALPHLVEAVVRRDLEEEGLEAGGGAVAGGMSVDTSRRCPGSVPRPGPRLPRTGG